jgi:hypothetical protein
MSGDSTKADTDRMRGLAKRLVKLGDSLNGYDGGLDDVLVNTPLANEKFGTFNEATSIANAYSQTSQKSHQLCVSYQSLLYSMASNITTFCDNYEKNQDSDAGGFKSTGRNIPT